MLRSYPTKMMSKMRVPAGFIMAALYFYLCKPTPGSILAGGLVAFLGILIRAWATGHIRKNDELTVTGPYAFTRNPLYFGSFIIGLGFSIAGTRLDLLIAFLVLFGALYGNALYQEMKFLQQRFPEQYAQFSEKVPLFFPRLWPREVRPQAFDWQRYLRNREYQALMGYLAAICLLLLKVRV